MVSGLGRGTLATQVYDKSAPNGQLDYCKCFRVPVRVWMLMDIYRLLACSQRKFVDNWSNRSQL